MMDATKLTAAIARLPDGKLEHYAEVAFAAGIAAGLERHTDLAAAWFELAELALAEFDEPERVRAREILAALDPDA
jgi:hypothetical protein